MNGFINFYKPSGESSAKAISKIKKKFKGEKIGHMGTLDPMASGVLPVALGKATRLFDFLLDKTKVYRAEFTFGYETDTLDAEGTIVKDGGRIPTFDEILVASNSLVGVIDQIPPAYSAKNVAGKRSYELARQGKIVDLPPKQVEIISITPSKTDKTDTFSFEIKCKGGTYIRAIARDIAKILNTYATMTALIRENSGGFDISTALKIDEVIEMEDVSSVLIKPDSVLTLESVNLTPKQEGDLINGRPCAVNKNNGFYKVYYNDCFYGVGAIEEGNLRLKAYLKD